VWLAWKWRITFLVLFFGGCFCPIGLAATGKFLSSCLCRYLLDSSWRDWDMGQTRNHCFASNKASVNPHL
jgi:hypothetical protein